MEHRIIGVCTWMNPTRDEYRRLEIYIKHIHDLEFYNVKQNHYRKMICQIKGIFIYLNFFCNLNR